MYDIVWFQYQKIKMPVLLIHTHQLPTPIGHHGPWTLEIKVHQTHGIVPWWRQRCRKIHHLNLLRWFSQNKHILMIFDGDFPCYWWHRRVMVIYMWYSWGDFMVVYGIFVQQYDIWVCLQMGSTPLIYGHFRSTFLGENFKSFILRSNEKLLTRKKQQKIQRRFFWYLGLGQICKTM